MSDPIASSPPFEWAAGQQIDFDLYPLALKSGTALADYGTVTITVREDPVYPRAGADLDAPADPYGEGWSVAVTAVGTPGGTPGDERVGFSFTAPSAPGRRRYVVDVRTAGGSEGEVSLLDATFVTIKPRVG